MNGLESPPNAFDSKNPWPKAFNFLEFFKLGVLAGFDGADPSLAVVGMEFEGMKVTESFTTRAVGARFFPTTRSREIPSVSSLNSTESMLGGGLQYSSFVLA